MFLVKSISLWLFCLLALMIFVSACGTSPANLTGSTGSKVLNVVAAENFYGDIVKQLGGDQVSVTSILSDPNVDPHEYESNVQETIAISKADLVIKNGDNYDAWIDKLLASTPNANRTVLTASGIANHKLPDNPHVWYSIDNVETIATSITGTLKKLDSHSTSTFDSNLTTFLKSLTPIRQKMSDIKSTYAGTPIGLTETIYLYQTGPMELKVLTPLEFEKAIAEGNDPPANTVTSALDQVNKQQIKVLIYNEQTNTPITNNLQTAAKALHIPVVPVTETMPPDKTYQSWMLGQLNALQQALATSPVK